MGDGVSIYTGKTTPPHLMVEMWGRGVSIPALYRKYSKEWKSPKFFVVNLISLNCTVLFNTAYAYPGLLNYNIMEYVAPAIFN